jgi:hypothetical protein
MGKSAPSIPLVSVVPSAGEAEVSEDRMQACDGGACVLDEAGGSIDIIRRIEAADASTSVGA